MLCAYLLVVFLSLDAELLVDLVLDGKAVAVPAEAALDVVPALRRISCDDILREGERASAGVP